MNLETENFQLSPVSTFTLPFVPIRRSLYSAKELFGRFDPADPNTFAATTDFEIYRHYIGTESGATKDPYVAMTRAMHDNGITQLRNEVIAKQRVAAIMGGHKMKRDSADYRNVCLMGRGLAQSGLLVATGGGPGAMEAGHLGALTSTEPVAALDAAIGTLARHAALPDMRHIAVLAELGVLVDGDLVKQAHRWFAPAWEVASTWEHGVRSLAVPTWHYGFEPTTPFATDIAKYFQNSVREDGLLEIATAGIIFTPGRAGTLQEIFQDGAQNYYRSFGDFSPMVFFGVEYWTRTLPVLPVLKSLFKPADFDRCVHLTDDPDEAVRFIAEG